MKTVEVHLIRNYVAEGCITSFAIFLDGLPHSEVWSLRELFGLLVKMQPEEVIWK